MKLYLARHGQSTYNVEHICNSDPTVYVPLTDKGQQQAVKLAEELRDVQIDTVIVSELVRTQQTAEFVNKYHDAPTVIDARLNDNDSGMEGKPNADYQALVGQSDDIWNFRYGSGESIEDVKLRARAFLKDLKVNYDGTVLVVTSQVIMRVMYGLVNELSNEKAWEYVPDNATYIVIDL